MESTKRLESPGYPELPIPQTEANHKIVCKDAKADGGYFLRADCIADAARRGGRHSK
jgi:hypothetical protein